MWRLAGGHALRYRAWNADDLAVVYHPLSGDTHLIDASALEVLKLLGGGPRSTQSVIDGLSAVLPDEDQPTLCTFVDSTLLQLQGIGLVSAVPI